MYCRLSLLWVLQLSAFTLAYSFFDFSALLEKSLDYFTGRTKGGFNLALEAGYKPKHDFKLSFPIRVRALMLASLLPSHTLLASCLCCVVLCCVVLYNVVLYNVVLCIIAD
jgi:hypothetical protein